MTTRKKDAPPEQDENPVGGDVQEAMPGTLADDEAAADEDDEEPEAEAVPNTVESPTRVAGVVPLDELDDVQMPNLGALPETVAHRRRVQHGEYGQYIAAYDIRTADTNTLAFAAGHPVPVDLVDNDGRVVTARHYCNHPDGLRCGKFNAATAWTEPGAAVPTFTE